MQLSALLIVINQPLVERRVKLCYGARDDPRAPRPALCLRRPVVRRGGGDRLPERARGAVLRAGRAPLLLAPPARRARAAARCGGGVPHAPPARGGARR